jgi:hypothetical protein
MSSNRLRCSRVTALKRVSVSGGLHDRLVRAVLDVFGGEVVKSTGDGALALLPSADLLVRAGSAVADAAEHEALPLRVGLATGDVVRTATDCFGEAAVVATRLCGLAAAGQTLVAPSTDVVRGGRFEPPLVSVGRHSLKGFDESMEVLQVVRTRSEPRSSDAAVSLVGREAAVAAIEAAWAIQPAPLVVVRGEPGIGKTQLARALAARHDDVEVVWVAFESSLADGFVRWCDAIDERAARMPVGVIAMLGRSRVGRLAALLPSVAERLPIAAASTVGEGDRELSFDALVAVLGSLGRDVLIVLDDIQWGGATAAAFLQWIVSARPAAVRLLATCRPPLPDGLAQFRPPVVDLGGLAADDLFEVLRIHGTEREIARAAVARSGGNPFLAIVSATARHMTGSHGADTDPISERFLALDRQVVDTLAQAALLGRSIDLSLVNRVTHTAPTEIQRALDVGLQAGLLRMEGAAIGFTHDLVRETAAARVQAHARAALHARAATAYRDRGDAPMEASHLLEGYAALEPIDGARRVAATLDALTQLGAFEETYAMALRFVDIVEADQRCGPRARAIALIAALSAAQRYPAFGTENMRLAVLAGQAAAASHDPDILAEVALLRGGFGTVGRPDQATVELIDEALRQLAPSSQALIARLRAMRAFHLATFEGQGARARPEARAAVDAARDSGDASALAESLAAHSYVLLASSDVQLAAATIDEALSLVPQLSPTAAAHVQTTCARNGAVLGLQLGDRARFEKGRQDISAWSRRWNRVVLTNMVTMWRGLIANLDGAPDEAEAQASTLLNPRSSDLNFVHSARVLLAVSHRWRGSVRSVRDQLDDRLSEARELVDKTVQSARPLVDDTTLAAQAATLIEACALSGLPVPQLVADVLQPFSGQLIVLAWAADVPGAADRFLAIEAALRGDEALAAARFERAETLERPVSEPLALRTRVWRHSTLGDVEMPFVSEPLLGLHREAAALQHRHT